MSEQRSEQARQTGSLGGKSFDTTGIDLYGPRSGSKPALNGSELTRLLKGNASLAKSLKISI